MAAWARAESMIEQAELLAGCADLVASALQIADDAGSAAGRRAAARSL
jgi:hypothetical protein